MVELLKKNISVAGVQGSVNAFSDFIQKWLKFGVRQAVLCASSPKACVATKTAKDEAVKWSAKHSYSNRYNGGRIDAARHIYWTAQMTRMVNADWAQKFSDAHELDVTSNGVICV